MTQTDEKLLLARLSDLEHGAERGVRPSFSRFLDPGEIAVFQKQMHRKGSYMLWGGYSEAERKMLGFFPDYLEPVGSEFPICVLRIRGGEPLGHRDVLGALLGLGIERNLVGDVVMEEEGPVVFACDSICDYISMNLEKAGRIRVSVNRAEPKTLAILPKAFEIISGTVASLRLDCILSLLTGASRSDTEALLKREWVSVNFQVCTKGSVSLNAGDVLSVRKFGRAELFEVLGETKKGRMRVKIKKYI